MDPIEIRKTISAFNELFASNLLLRSVNVGANDGVNVSDGVYDSTSVAFVVDAGISGNNVGLDDGCNVGLNEALDGENVGLNGKWTDG